MQLSRGLERLEDHGAFAADSEGVEDVERVVSIIVSHNSSLNLN